MARKFNIMWTTFFERMKTNPLKTTLFDLHVYINKRFRGAYDRVAKEVVEYAHAQGLTHVVELGAGTAPLTKLIAEDPEAADLHLSPCDLIPHAAEYRALAARYPGRVAAVTSAVNFSNPRDWGPGTLLVLLGTFPAINPEARQGVLKALTDSSDRVMVCEHVRKTPLSMCLASCSFFAGLLLPLAWLGKPGRLRRFFWCWLCPAVPIMFAIDGVCWCLRSWSDAQWKEELAEVVDSSRTPNVRSWVNSQTVTW